MTHVNFLVHKPLVSETQTDRQTRQICNRYPQFFSYLIIPHCSQLAPPDVSTSLYNFTLTLLAYQFLSQGPGYEP